MAGEGSKEVGQAPAADRVVPERRRQEPEWQRPDEQDEDELDDREREVDPDIEHVTPAALIGELGAQDREDAAAKRAIRVGEEAFPASERDPPPFQPGDDTRGLDPDGDEQHTDACDEGGEPGRCQRDHDGEREHPHDEAQPDRGVRVPGGRVDRGQQEGPDRVSRSAGQPERADRVGIFRVGTQEPRRSEGRSVGDPGRRQPGQDEQQSDEEDCTADHDLVGSRRTALATRRAPIPRMNAGHRNRPWSAQSGSTVSTRARAPNRIRTIPTIVVRRPVSRGT